GRHDAKSGCGNCQRQNGHRRECLADIDDTARQRQQLGAGFAGNEYRHRNGNRARNDGRRKDDAKMLKRQHPKALAFIDDRSISLRRHRQKWRETRRRDQKREQEDESYNSEKCRQPLHGVPDPLRTKLSSVIWPIILAFSSLTGRLVFPCVTNSTRASRKESCPEIGEPDASPGSIRSSTLAKASSRNGFSPLPTRDSTNS